MTTAGNPRRRCYCGAQFRVPSETPLEQLCTKHRTVETALEAVVVELPGGGPAPAAPTGPSSELDRRHGAPGPVEAAARRELEAAGRLETLPGAVVVNLARDTDKGLHNGSQRAALAARLLAAREVALEGAKVAEDALDELRRRREAKASSA